MKIYSIRVWKILDENKKQLIDIVETDNINFKNAILKEFKNLYLEFYNYIIEVKNNKTQKIKLFTGV